MSQVIQYLNHVLYDPGYYQRDYEHDLSVDPQEQSLASQAQRALMIAVPFLSLHRPFGLAISGVMGSARLVTHLHGSVQAFDQNILDQLGSEVLQTALAVAALAGSVFQFQLGLLITTGSDAILHFTELLEHIANEDHQKSLESGVHILSDMVYLATMMTGSLEIVFLSYLVQVFISLYQSKKEYDQGNIPEALAKALMGSIRGFQANKQYQQIQRRNALFRNEDLANLAGRVGKGRDVEHLLNHPLAELIEQIENHKVVFTDAEGNVYNFGSHFTGAGEGLVKGMNVCFKNKEIDGENITELTFKINHAFRGQLQSVIEEVQGFSVAEIAEVLELSQSHASNMKLERVNFWQQYQPYKSQEYEKYAMIGDAYKISLEGLGEIYIGANPDLPTQYDRITVHMKEGATIFQMHELLSFFQLDAALHLSMMEDIQRMQIGQLYRIFCPKDATAFERTREFFDLSISELRAKILDTSPEMKDVFERYMARTDFRSIYDGKDRLAVDGLGEEMKDIGALGLTAALTGTSDPEKIFQRTASILEMGMMSLEQRTYNGVQTGGLSWTADLYAGSSDSVFTQMITDRDCENGLKTTDFYYSGKVRFLFSTRVLDMGTYQYLYDEFGTRRMNNYYWWQDDTYANRPSIVDFTSAKNEGVYWGNEVMIKDHIRTEYIQGMIVADEITKNEMIEYLQQKNIVKLDSQGNRTILGIDVDRFIHVGTEIKKEYFQN